MPELPEVQTTVNGLNETVAGLTITDVWTNYDSPHFYGTPTIKDPLHFAEMKRSIIGKKIINATRRAKSILIHLEGGDTILVHMKMTGHLLYGTYRFDTTYPRDPWRAVEPLALTDSFNRHVHFVLSFSNHRHLALSDVRTFAKVALISGDIHNSDHLKSIGPEPLDNSFTLPRFIERINTRRTSVIKTVLMDQTVIAGIGNIYADESLWRAGIHPLTRVRSIPAPELKTLFTALKETLARGINFGGDSTSDYRNIHGEKGRFHEGHHAYQRTGTPCDKKGCTGILSRIVVGGRGTHFCPNHQRLVDE